MSTLFYTGDRLRQQGDVIVRPGKIDEPIFPYEPDPDLVKAVNMALLLKRPLLVMGEPGCGKSELARALAYELYHGRVEENGDILDFRQYYAEWPIKSTSKAREGLYEYDAIARLADAQLVKEMSETERAEWKKKDYIRYGPMGDAFRKSTDENHRVVLLIDEIDKADIDFPNDLLNELDKGEFFIPEKNDFVRAAEKPIVIITSNNEKGQLPDAFLRRCLFHYIRRFDENQLFRIISRRFYDTFQSSPELVEQAAKIFVAVRDHIQANKMSVGKNVSTAELIDWFKVISHYQRIEKPAVSPPGALKSLFDELQKLTDGRTPEAVLKDIPFHQVLLKNHNTLLTFNKSGI